MTFLTNLAGVLLEALTPGTAVDGENAKFTLGLRGRGNDGSEWVYVQANGALSQYFCVAISGAFQASPVNNARMVQGYEVGFAQVAFADNDFGWVCTRASGVQKVLTRGSCVSGVPLYTDASASGFLDDSATATQSLIEGVVILTTRASTTGQEGAGDSILATFPHTR